MAEVIAVKKVPWGQEEKNLIALTSLEDLQKIADGYGLPFILKKDNEHFLYVDVVKSVFTYKQ